MKVSVAQINPIIGDFRGNRDKIVEAIRLAKEAQADIVLFPELSICGYPPEDLLLHHEFVEENEKALQEIIRASQGIAVVVGLARKNIHRGQALLNSAAILSNGELLGYYDKMLLPTYNVFDERRYFEPGKGVKTWQIKGKKIAVVICEDIWRHAGYADIRYKKDPVAALIPEKPDLLLNLSASPYHFEKPTVRVEVCAKTARSLNCPVILCCQVGAHDTLVFDGYSVCVDAKGALRELGKGFEEDFFTVDLEAPVCSLPPHYDVQSDLYRALVLGVKDYFAKQGFSKACLGLSGGIDSALVACIAVEALGAENILGVALPSRYSSAGSLRDAQTLADNLGISFKVISIEEPFSAYLSLLTPHFDGKQVDATEENLQARIRGMILMALSNKHGYIVLSTGNKSEMGLGYCTLYGDMCGGLGVIADVYKTQVYDLARWINRKEELIPLASIEKPPSAELRANQLDRDSLPDYETIDRVMKGYIEDLLSPQQISEKFHISRVIVDDLIGRIFRAEYKRRQAPPGIRVSKKAFSVGRRVPIVQKYHR